MTRRETRLPDLTPGVAVTLVSDAGVAGGRLLSVTGASANGVAIDVRLSSPAASGLARADRAILRIPVGSRSVAFALAELASRTASE